MINKKKSNLIMIFLIIGIIIIIGLIFYLKNLGNGTDEELLCVAEKSYLYVLKTCSHCANQKAILGDALKDFNLIDCADNSELCANKGIIGVPTWEINGEFYSGVKSVNELKELANC